MKRAILTLTALACTLTMAVRAQYVRVNIDAKTIAAMSSAFGAESAAEM